MNKFKNPMIAAAVLTGLALIGSLMNSHPSVLQAAGGPTVTIDPARLPLHVTGSTTVAGTVAATQNGIWNVGINGTPSVRVADDPGRIPFQSTKYCTPSPGSCSATFGPTPSGRRLVIEYVSGAFGFNAVPLNTKILMNSPANTVTFNIPPPSAPLPIDVSFNERVRLYVDQGQTVTATVFSSATPVPGYFMVAGYLLDCNAAPCAAIASF